MPLHSKVTKPRDDMIEKIVEATWKRMEAQRSDDPPQSDATGQTEAAADKTGRETGKALRHRMKNRRPG